ncbi:MULTISPECIES: DUF1624 domain-containing protein [Falsihalocynthiibacter]|uniref:DUF1624 domain-containing protein n=1 Tax=Falsihalocynthiibacter TaxID=2854182 RepID=UPI0030016395
MISKPNQSQPTARLVTVDVLKSTALVGMIIFHFAYDLELFGYLAQGTMAQSTWLTFARIVAGSFLFLSGVGLSLAHFPTIRWPDFLRRLKIIGLAALVITFATYIAVPDQFIYFGILHVIAISSLAGLLFLRMNLLLVFLAAVLVFVLPFFFRTEALNTPILTWIGLSTQWRPSMDFEPFFPWFAPFLAGIFSARFARQFGLISAGPPPETMPSSFLKKIRWASRNSLTIYLVHQPILIGVLWGWSRLAL